MINEGAIRAVLSLPDLIVIVAAWSEEIGDLGDALDMHIVIQHAAPPTLKEAWTDMAQVKQALDGFMHERFAADVLPHEAAIIDDYAPLRFVFHYRTTRKAWRDHVSNADSAR